MRYTVEEGGRLNNYAIEPKVYQAEPPTQTQRRNYFAVGIGGLVLVAGLVFVAVAVS